MNKDDTILVTGASGLVGSAIVRRLVRLGFCNVVPCTSKMCDLRDPEQTGLLFKQNRPDWVFHCAARVAGIMGHLAQPVEIFRDNTRIQLNVLHNAWKWCVEGLVFTASACAYPKHAATPIREDSLLTGPLEPSNELYALAKISGVKLCDAYQKEHGRDFFSVMPTNMYGPRDNYHPEHSHVIPGMIRKFHDAYVANASHVILWGTGKPKRDFLFSDDAASAIHFVMDHWKECGPVNVCSGRSVALWELADEIRAVVGFKGEIVWDSTKPDGTPDRTMDDSKLRALGWQGAGTSLATGLEIAYADFLRQL